MSGAELDLGVADTERRWDTVAAHEDYRSYLYNPPTAGTYDASGVEYAEMLRVHFPDHRAVVVEVGCGDGRVTKHLAPFYNTVHAVDISAAMLRHLEKDAPPNVKTYRSDGSDLHIVVPGPVECVFSCLTLQHNPKSHVARIVESCRRLLQDGGLLCVQLPVYDEGRDVEHFRDVAAWTPSELLLLAEDSGFTIERLARSVGRFEYRWPGPNFYQLQVLRRTEGRPLAAR